MGFLNPRGGRRGQRTQPSASRGFLQLCPTSKALVGAGRLWALAIPCQQDPDKALGLRDLGKVSSSVRNKWPGCWWEEDAWRPAEGRQGAEGTRDAPWAASEPPPPRSRLPLCSPSLLPKPGEGRQAARTGGSGGGRAGSGTARGSGMPGIQVTRGCEINGSSEEPRTARRSLAPRGAETPPGRPPSSHPLASSQKPAPWLPFFGRARPQKSAFLHRHPNLPCPCSFSSPDSSGKPQGCPIPFLPHSL